MRGSRSHSLQNFKEYLMLGDRLSWPQISCSTKIYILASPAQLDQGRTLQLCPSFQRQCFKQSRYLKNWGHKFCSMSIFGKRLHRVLVSASLFIGEWFVSPPCLSRPQVALQEPDAWLCYIPLMITIVVSTAANRLRRMYKHPLPQRQLARSADINPDCIMKQMPPHHAHVRIGLSAAISMLAHLQSPVDPTIWSGKNCRLELSADFNANYVYCTPWAKANLNRFRMAHVRAFNKKGVTTNNNIHLQDNSTATTGRLCNLSRLHFLTQSTATIGGCLFTESSSYRAFHLMEFKPSDGIQFTVSKACEVFL